MHLNELLSKRHADAANTGLPIAGKWYVSKDYDSQGRYVASASANDHDKTRLYLVKAVIHPATEEVLESTGLITWEV